MTTPSEDSGWRKGDKTSQGLDAYSLLEQAHAVQVKEIESLAAQLAHRTAQRDNQRLKIAALVKVQEDDRRQLTDCGHLTAAQNITIENQTAALARQEAVLRQLRQERSETEQGDQRNLTSVHDLEDELQGLKVEREKLLQSNRELRRDKDTLERLLGTEKVAVSELRAQVEMATADRKSAIARAEELLAEREELAERLQRLEQLRTEDQAAIEQQSETIKTLRAQHDRVPSLLGVLSQIQDAVRDVTNYRDTHDR